MDYLLINIIQLLNKNAFTSHNIIKKILKINNYIFYTSVYNLQNRLHLKISEKNKKYKLEEKITFICRKKINKNIANDKIKVTSLYSTNSTSDYLFNNNCTVCLAEYQKKGKAQFYRYWHSPFGKNIYLSLKTKVRNGKYKTPHISLAIASIVVSTLINIFPFFSLKIKWPNDIYVNNKKIAGILINKKLVYRNTATLIIGIGLNVNMNNTSKIYFPWASLKNSLERYVDRNIIITVLIKNIMNGVKILKKNNYEKFMHSYKKYQYLKNKIIRINIISYNKIVKGICRGINEKGQIILLTAKKIYYFNSSELSIISQCNK